MGAVVAVGTELIEGAVVGVRADVGEIAGISVVSTSCCGSLVGAGVTVGFGDAIYIVGVGEGRVIFVGAGLREVDGVCVKIVGVGTN